MTDPSTTTARYLSALDTTLAVARAHVTDLEAERDRVLAQGLPPSVTGDAEPPWLSRYLFHLRRSRSHQVVTISRSAALLAHAVLVATLVNGRSVLHGAHVRQLRALIAYLDGTLDTGLDPSDHAIAADRPPRRQAPLVDRPRPGAARGARHGKVKLTEEQVLTIRAQGETGRPIREMAMEFNVSRVNVFQILKRMTWRHLP